MNGNATLPSVNVTNLLKHKQAKREEEEEPLLIYTAQDSLFRCEKPPVINGSPKHNNVQNYTIHISITLIQIIIYNGNRTEWSSIWSVIIRVINKLGRRRSGSPIC